MCVDPIQWPVAGRVAPPPHKRARTRWQAEGWRPQQQLARRREGQMGARAVEPWHSRRRRHTAPGVADKRQLVARTTVQPLPCVCVCVCAK